MLAIRNLINLPSGDPRTVAVRCGVAGCHATALVSSFILRLTGAPAPPPMRGTGQLEALQGETVGLLEQYDPPAHLPDVDAVPGQREAWHRYVCESFEDPIKLLVDAMGDLGVHGKIVPSFFDSTLVHPGALVEQDIVWNAFPMELQRLVGREQALVIGDLTWPVSVFEPNLIIKSRAVRLRAGSSTRSGKARCRLTSEYCEWHVDRRTQDRRIQRVTFSCESPEYWQALFGGDRPLPDRESSVKFPGDPKLVLDLYRTLVNPAIQMKDLVVHKAFNTPLGEFNPGDYNPYNAWNVERGIVHLTAPPNSFKAAIHLAAMAVTCYQDASAKLLVRPEDIAAHAKIGNVNRNSDLAILGLVNALTRTGRWVTLANPVGFYIDHIDLSGWQVPHGFSPEDCVCVSRGSGRSTTRLVVEVPSTQHHLEEVSINGIPLTSGGQIAECITLRLRAAASLSQELQPILWP